MNSLEPVRPEQLQSLTNTQLDVFNNVYRNAPIYSGEWRFVFERNLRYGQDKPRLEKNSIVELTVQNGPTSTRVLLELLIDMADPSWRHYESDIQLLAWSVNHLGLLDCLNQVLLGQTTVKKIEVKPQTETDTPEIESHLSDPPLDFSLTNSEGDTQWCGRLWNCADLIKEHVFQIASENHKNWLNLTIPIPMTLADLEISKHELGAIEVGGFIRLNHCTTDPLETLHLACGRLNIVAAADGTKIRVISISRS